MGHHHTKKPYLQFLHKPILTHTVSVFDQNPIVDGIYVVVNSSDFDLCQSIAISPYGFKKVSTLISGGETRQESVFNGLQALPDDADFVIVHDGVRPFVTDELVSVCLEGAVEWGAAVAAVPFKDTIKVSDADGFIVDTPNRSRLWAVQTPQTFRKHLLLEAHQHARQNGVNAADDAALVEKLGFRVKLVPGSYRNLKITTPEDFVIAKALGSMCE